MSGLVRASAMLLLVLAAAACGPASEAPPATELSIEILGLPEAADLGKAFPLTIIRRWTRDHEALPFDAAALQPMVFAVHTVKRHGFATHWRETIQGEAWLLDLAPVDHWSAGFEARALAGGRRSEARSAPRALRVLPARKPGDSLDAELPTELHLIPPRALVVLISCTLLVSALWTLWFLRRHSRRRQPVAAKPAPRARLAALVHASPREGADWDRWHVELSGALRDHLEERHAVAAPRMTTEELARDPEAGMRCGAAHAPSLTLLRECDAVKFAAETVQADEAEVRLAAARRLVERETP